MQAIHGPTIRSWSWNYQLLHNKLNLETSDLFTTATLSTTRGHNYISYLSPK